MGLRPHFSVPDKYLMNLTEMAHSKIARFREFLRAKSDDKVTRPPPATPDISNGFRMIGFGMHSHVYTKDNYPYVIKVFKRDVMYMRWLQFVMANQNNPYLPKVRGKVVRLTNDIYAIRLEKLVPFKRAAQSRTNIDLVNMISTWQLSQYQPYESQGIDKDLMQVYEFLKRYRVHYDTGADNVMLRQSTNHIVLIDPLYQSRRDNTINPNDLSSLKNLF